MLVPGTSTTGIGACAAAPAPHIGPANRIMVTAGAAPRRIFLLIQFIAAPWPAVDKPVYFSQAWAKLKVAGSWFRHVSPDHRGRLPLPDGAVGMQARRQVGRWGVDARGVTQRRRGMPRRPVVCVSRWLDLLLAQIAA